MPTPLSPALNAATAGADLSVHAFAALAHRHGYRWIELNRSHLAPLHGLGPAAARAMLEREEVRIASFFLPVEWLAEAPTFDRQMERFGELTAFLADLGAQRCCTWLLPNLPRPAAEMRAMLRTRFGRIAETLDRAGLCFGLEFLGPAHFRDDPGTTFLYRMDDMLAFAEAIGRNVGLLVDSFHWHCEGGDAAALAAIPPGRLIYAHINDAPDRPRDAQRDDHRLLPGDGIIDLRSFLAALVEAGYGGPVGIEVDGPALAALTPDAAAQRARRAWDMVSEGWRRP